MDAYFTRILADSMFWTYGHVVKVMYTRVTPTLGGPSEVHSCKMDHFWRRKWTFKSPIFGFFFLRSWKSRSDLFKSGLYLPWRRLPLDPAKTEPARTEQVHLLSLSSLSDFSSLTFLSFLAHISLLHAQKSSRHNTRRVFYILHYRDTFGSML